MKKSDQLKLERTAKLEAQGALLTKAKAENRDLTPEEIVSFDALGTEVENLDVQVERAMKIEATELRIASNEGKKLTSEGDSSEKKELREIEKRFSIVRAMNLINPANRSSLDGAEKEVNEIGKEQSRAAGVNVPEGTSFSMPISMLRATQQTVSQDSVLMVVL